MTETLWVLVGLVTGGLLMWVLARGHFRSAALADREVLHARVAAAETLTEEIRRRLSQRDLELSEVRHTLDVERAIRVQSEVRCDAARANVEEQRQLLEQMQIRLGDTFKALSADALRDSGASFLTLAGERLASELGQQVQPLQEALERYEVHIRDLESSRQQAYGSLEQQVRALAVSSSELQREAGNLVSALRTPHVRGRWGEITLHRVVELSGMTAHCDYVEQVTTERDGNRLRPDMVVHLPVGRQIVVDAKVPLNAYLDAMNARTPEERAGALGRHAHQVRQHMTALAGKAYWEEFGASAELVVMFIPGEPFVAAAVEMDPSLIEDAMGRKVVIATPSTLIALLRAIAFGWRQEQIAENAERICELGRQLYDRLRTLGEHFDDVGRSLARATAAYNKSVGSMESRVLPAARRFRDLGAATGAEIPSLEAIDEQPRELTAPEYSRQFGTPRLAE